MNTFQGMGNDIGYNSFSEDSTSYPEMHQPAYYPGTSGPVYWNPGVANQAQYPPVMADQLSHGNNYPGYVQNLQCRQIPRHPPTPPYHGDSRQGLSANVRYVQPFPIRTVQDPLTGTHRVASRADCQHQMTSGNMSNPDEQPCTDIKCPAKNPEETLFVPTDNHTPTPALERYLPGLNRASKLSRSSSDERLTDDAQASAEVNIGRQTRSSRVTKRKAMTMFRSRANSPTVYTPSRSASPVPTPSVNTAKKAKRTPLTDPENRTILHLRTVERLTWGTIAARMNEQRRARGGEEKFTDAAVYGRFKRNAKGIVDAEEGENEFDVGDWMYLRKNPSSERMNLRGGRAGGGGVHASSGEQKHVLSMTLADAATEEAMVAFTEEDNETLKGIYEEVSGELWVQVAERLRATIGKDVSAEVCARRVALSTEGESLKKMEL